MRLNITLKILSIFTMLTISTAASAIQPSNYINSSPLVLFNMDSGLVIDAHLPPDTIIRHYNYHGGENQRWVFEDANQGRIRIKNIKSGLYIGLDEKGVTVQQAKSNERGQLWIIENVGISNGMSGVRIRSTTGVGYLRPMGGRKEIARAVAEGDKNGAVWYPVIYTKPDDKKKANNSFDFLTKLSQWNIPDDNFIDIFLHIMPECAELDKPAAVGLLSSFVARAKVGELNLDNSRKLARAFAKAGLINQAVAYIYSRATGLENDKRQYLYHEGFRSGHELFLTFSSDDRYSSILQSSTDISDISYQIFWMVYNLHIKGENGTVIDVLGRIPKKLWYPCSYDTEIYRIYAKALVEQGAFEEGLQQLLEAIAINDKRQNDNYHLLLHPRFGISARFVESKNFEALFDNALIYFRNTGFENYQASEGLFQFCVVQASESINKGDIQRALLYRDILNEIAQGHIKNRKPNEPAVDTIKNAEHYTRAIEYRINNIDKVKTAYRFKWLGVFFTGTDMEMKDGNGNTYRRVYQMPEHKLKELIRYNHEQARTAAMFYFYLTEGNIDMEFDFVEHRSVIKKVGVNEKGNLVGSRISQGHIEPNPGELLYRNINNYDGIIYLYEKEINGGNWYGGPNHPMFVPFSTFSLHSRSSMWLNIGGCMGIYIHEMFHNFEWDIKPTHGFLEENREHWSDEYRKAFERFKGSSEHHYYVQKFRDVINPKGYDRFKNRLLRPDNMPREQFDSLMAGFYKVGLEKAELSDQLFEKAQNELHNKNYNEAKELYKKALELNPYNHRGTRNLINLFNSNLSSLDEKYIYFRQYLEHFPTVDLSYSRWVADQLFGWYFRNKRFEELVTIYEKVTGVFAGTELASLIDYYFDRALEGLGRIGEVKKTVPDENGVLINYDFTNAHIFDYYKNVKFNLQSGVTFAEFNGVDSHIDLGARRYITGKNPFIIRAEVMSVANGKRQIIIQQRSKQAFDGEYMLYVNPDGTVELFVFGEGRESVKIKTDISIQDGKFHKIEAHLMGNGNAVINIDGKTAAEKPYRPVNLVPIQVYIGGDLRDNRDYFYGGMRSVSVHIITESGHTD